MKHLYKSGRFIHLAAIFLAFSIHAISQPFTLQTGISFSTISDGSFAWGDYDNDNDLDLLFGSVYRNNGDNTFTKQTQIKLPVLRYGSSDWCDFNNDGFLDILITGSDSTKIYLNNKDNSFTELEETGLLGMNFCDAACADFNNDGYPDILTIGLEKTIYQSSVAILYINNKDNTFRRLDNISFSGSERPNIDCGDYDNDGNIDILCSGGSYSQIYRNNGNETFSLAFLLKKLANSSVCWGDYNNDSYLDVLLSGHTGTSCFAAVYKNIEGTSFEQQTGISLPPYSSGTVAWGDYDNDGDLDILINGECSSDTKIYSNNGDNTFTFESGISLPPVAYGQSAWVDYDNDSDLDLFFAGLSSYGFIADIYRNDGTTSNTAPSAPSNLTSTVNGDTVTLKWNKTTDNETPQNCLTYNIYIHKIDYPQLDEIIMPSNSNVSTGYRKVISGGNVGHDTSFTVSGLPTGFYLWSIQAIDNNFEGSEFASGYYEDYFYVYPTIQAKNMGADSITGNTISISWENGNGDKRAVFAKQGTTGKASPSDGVSFEADSILGNGDHIGNGWYCVYTGYDNHTAVTGLTPDSTYRFMVCEYADVIENYLYNKDTASGNPINITISKMQQTITFGKLGTKIYGDAPFQLTASASSGLPVSYTSSNTNVATISGNMVTIVGAGETVITASQEGNNVYDAANNVEQALTVNKANQSITFNQLVNKTINDVPFQLTATVNSGLPVNYTSSNTEVATISGDSLTITGIGTATITARQEGNNNYEAAIPVEQELTVTPGTGLDKISVSSVNIYPNPVKEKLTIHLGNAPESIVKYCVIDITGAVIQSGEFNSVSYCIEIKAPNKGVYLLKIDTQKDTIVKHIIKE